MNLRRLLLVPLALFISQWLTASDFDISGSIETVSAYLWRGDYVCGAHAYPQVSAKWGRVTFQPFAFLAFDSSYKEVDVDLCYSAGPFSFHVADYFARYASYTEKENYFNFKKGTTNHIQEAIICYEPTTLPFSLRWFTFVHGDWMPQSDGSLGRPTFSSFFEAEVYRKLSSGGQVALICGSSIGKGMYTSYTKDFAVVHMEFSYSRRIILGKLTLPVGISYVTNPYSGKTWMKCSLGVEF
ncbi:MAG: hypothetical protein J5632_01205 [Bacteroidales bacterium]|nr:hypothetical protein [Bacteroidales bacterium]